jgi:hypothetical protein
LVFCFVLVRWDFDGGAEELACNGGLIRNNVEEHQVQVQFVQSSKFNVQG